MKKVLFILIVFGLMVGQAGLAQNPTATSDQLDSLLIESLSDPGAINLFDIFYQNRKVLKKALDCSPFNGNLQIIEQGENICLISNVREQTQIFISNYQMKQKDFSIILLTGDKKFVYLVNRDGDGGYYRNDIDGYLVLNSLFIGANRFKPMPSEEICYFNEKIVKFLWLVKR
jgi:hypothetical protein